MDITLTPAPEWQDKVWGRTKCVFRGQNFEVHELEIKAGGYCSRHRHRKWNRFHVMAGTLEVDLFATPDGPAEGRALGAGEFFSVAPETWHRFAAKSDCHVLEVYWTTDISPEDIERFDSGGMNDTETTNTEE